MLLVFSVYLCFAHLVEGVVEELDGVLPNNSLILAHLVEGVVELDGVLPNNSPILLTLWRELLRNLTASSPIAP